VRIAGLSRRAAASRDNHSVERLREAVYGTIILLSVLAVLDEKEPSALDAGLSVAGTAVVLFLAHVYAGSVAARIALGRETSRAAWRGLTAESWPVVTVTLWPLVLIALSALGVMSTAVAVSLSTWLAVAALGFWGWLAGVIGHDRLPGRLWVAARSLAVGLAIVALKVAFH
jgi:small-conductance mechanosensitive channel